MKKKKEASEAKAKKGGLKAFFRSRKTKRGAIAAAITAAFVGIIIIINVIAGILVDRFPNLQFDMTASQTYGLQKDTSEYLSQLDTDVTIYVLATESNFKAAMGASDGAQYFIQADKLLRKMAATSSKVKLKFMDLAANPTFTASYGDIDWTAENAANLILIDAGDGKYTALSLEDCFTTDSQASAYGYTVYTSTTIEEAVITGILDLTSGEKIKVDFILGSGEQESFYSDLQKLLKKNAYEINEVNLTTQKPHKKAKVAVLYAPTVDLSEEAVAKLEEWLDNDGNYGRTLVYIPVDVKTSTPHIDALLKDYGMKVSDGLAFCTDPQRYMQSAYMFLPDYNNDTYTENLKQANIPTITYYSRAVEIADNNAAQPLLSVESGAGVIPFSVDTTKDDINPDDYLSADGINIAAIGTKTNSDGDAANVAVFGSEYMFSSQFLTTSSYNNANYITNFFNTVTNRGDMGITITSASVDNGELGIQNAATVISAGVVFIGIIPLLVLIIGLVVYIRRRNR